MRMFRLLVPISIAMATCMEPAASAAAAEPAPSVATVCCNDADVRTLRDLVYIAQTTLHPSAEIAARLSALSSSLGNGTYRNWNDPDRAGLLALVANTPDGAYWRPLITAFASTIGTTVGASSPVVQPPAPTPAPTIPPAAASAGGLTEAQVRAIVAEEVAKLPAGASGTSGLVNIVEPPELHLTDLSNGLRLVFAISRNDDGLRLMYNMCYPPGTNGTYCRTDLPQGLFSFETEGAWSFNQSPVPSAKDQTWDNLAGKDLKIYGRGYRALGDNNGRYVSIVSGRVGKGIEFRTADSGDNNASLYRLKGRVDENGWDLMIDGALRRLHACNVGGIAVVCF